jgi:hypothetical protein
MLQGKMFKTNVVHIEKCLKLNFLSEKGLYFSCCSVGIVTDFILKYRGSISGGCKDRPLYLPLGQLSVLPSEYWTHFLWG